MNFFYANGTPIINSLKVTSEVPLDPRLTVENIAERDSLVTNHISYDRMKVYVKSNDTKYIYHKDTGEWEIDNKFSEEDKSKLDRINNYLIDTEYLYNPKNELLFREYSYDANTSITTLRDHILQEAKVTENGELYNGLLSKFYVNRLNNIRGYINSINITPSSENEDLYLVRNYYNPDSNINDTQNINIPIVTDYNNGLIDPATKHWIDNAKGLSIWGTTSETWQLGKDNIDERLDSNGGVIIKNSGGIAEIRNNTDTSYADLTLNNIIIKGDVTQEGKTFITEAETVEVKDNTLLLNRGEVGSGVTKGVAGIEIDRGIEPKYQILFDESDDRFKVGKEGDLWCVTLRDDDANMIDGMFTSWDASTKRLKTTNIVPESTPLLFGRTDYKRYSGDIVYQEKVFSSYSFIDETPQGTLYNAAGDSSWNIDTTKSNFRFWKPILGTTFKRTSDNSEVLYHADVVNDVVTGGSNKVLSAEQGKLLGRWIKPISLIKVVNDIALWEDSISYTIELPSSAFEILNQEELVYRFKNDIPFTIDMLYTANGITFKMHRDITFNGSETVTSIAFRCFVSQGGSCFDVQYWINFNASTGLPVSGQKRVVKMADNSYRSQTSSSDAIINKLKNITLYTEEYGTEGQVLLYKDSKPVWSDKLEITKDYLPLSGGTMTGDVKFTNSTSIIWKKSNGDFSADIHLNSDNIFNIGDLGIKGLVFRTSGVDLTHFRNGKSYNIWDAYNLPTPASTTDLNNYLPLAGGTLTGQLTIKQSIDIKLRLQSTDADNYCIIQAINAQASQLGVLGYAGDKWAIGHGGTYYEIWDKYNLTNPVTYTTNTYNHATLTNKDGQYFTYIKAGTNGLLPHSKATLASGGLGFLGTSDQSFNAAYINNLHTNKVTFGDAGSFIDNQSGDSSHIGIGFYTSQNAACPVYVGSLCVSDGYANSAPNIPANGIYSKGIIYIENGIGFRNSIWTNDLTPNRNYSGYLQVLDAYNAANAGGPTNYGTVLQINSRIDHWANQLWFGNNDNMYLRRMNYGLTTYGEWNRLLTNKDVNIIPTQSASNPSSLPVNQIFYSEIQQVTGTPTTQGALFSVQGDDEGIQLWASSFRNELYYRTKWTSYGDWIKLAATSDLGNYLPLSGGTISSSKSNPLTINSTHASQSSIDFSRGGVNKGTVGFYESLGSFLQNVTGETLAVKSDGAYYGVNTNSLRKLATVTDLGNYLPLTGGALSGTLTINTVGNHTLIINNNDTNGVETFVRVLRKGTLQAAIGFYDGLGAYIYNYNSDKYLFIDDDGYARVGTTSGSTRLALITDIPSISGYLPLSGGTMSGSISFNGNTGTIIFGARETSNFVTAVSFNKGSATNSAYIGYHSTGGSDSSGALVLVPYPTSANPWAKAVGLYIAKNELLLDGKAIATQEYVTWNNVAGKPTIYERTIGINGTYWSFYAPTNATSAMIYGPTSAGTSGQILQSTGGVPKWVNASSVVGNFVSKSGDTMTGALTMNSRRNNIVVDVVGGAGNSWDEGAGALSIQVPNDSGQTPLILARRSGAAINTTVATERLLSMELLDTGHSFIIGMSGSEALQLDWTSGKVGTGKLFGKQIATTDQIPSLSGYATQSWANSQFAPLKNYFVTSNYASIATTGNEMCIGSLTSGNSVINVNYRNGTGTTSPSTWYWRAGSSTTWANAYWGNLYMNNNLVATQIWASGQFPTKTGTDASGTWGISISGNAATATTATKWNGYSIWTGTEDELPSSRDANTLYFVKKSS